MKLDSVRLEPEDRSQEKRPHGPFGFAEVVGWLAEDLLWIDGWFTSSSHRPVELRLVTSAGEVRTEAVRFSHHREDLGEVPGAFGQILLAPVEQGLDADLVSVEEIWIRLDGAWYRWSFHRLPLLPHLEARLDDKVNRLSPDARRSLVRLLHSLELETRLEHEPPDPVLDRLVPVLERLFPELLEEVLEDEEDEEDDEDEEEEEPPEVFEAEIGYADTPLGLRFDGRWLLDRDLLALEGWLWDVEDQLRTLDLLEVNTPPEEADEESRRIPLLPHLFRFHLPEIEERYRPHYSDRALGEHGLWCLVPLPEEWEGKPGRVELVLESGRRLHLDPGLFGNDPGAVRKRLLEALSERQSTPGFRQRIFDPAWRALTARRRRLLRPTLLVAEGRAEVEEPAVSLVIPFDSTQELDPLVALLAEDPAARRGEVLLVLQSPRDEHGIPPLARHLRHLAELYEITLRTLVPDFELGPSEALRLAAESARGEHLLFLGRGVVPTNPGWLTALLDAHRELERPGILAPRLLFEDLSVADLGVPLPKTFDTPPEEPFTQPLAGLPATLPGAGERRPILGAGRCALVSRQALKAAGPLEGLYIDPAFELLDLGLRLHALGFESWCLPEPELFDLQPVDTSIFGAEDAPQGRAFTSCDRWRFAERWRELLGDQES